MAGRTSKPAVQVNARQPRKRNATHICSSGFCKKRNCPSPPDPPMSHFFQDGSFFFAVSSAAGAAGELCTTRKKEPDMGKRNTNSWEGQRPRCPRFATTREEQRPRCPQPQPETAQNTKIKLSTKTAQYRNQISTLLGVSPECATAPKHAFLSGHLQVASHATNRQSSLMSRFPPPHAHPYAVTPSRQSTSARNLHSRTPSPRQSAPPSLLRGQTPRKVKFHRHYRSIPSDRL